MTITSVWAETRRLADEWRQSALIQEFVEQLPANNPATAGIPEMLRNIDAGTGVVSGQPLIPNSWEAFAQQLPLVHLDAEAREFLTMVQPIGFATEIQTAWLRSRLPGYPLIPAPQLVPGTHRTMREVGRDLGWRREALQSGLQFEAAPRGVDQLLAIEQRSYREVIQSVAEALQRTAEWTTFAYLNAELTDDARRELVSARKSLRALLSPEAIDAYEPDRMVRREDYRRQQVAMVINELSDIAREFADAFEKIDELIDWVSLSVFGQLVAFGRPAVLTDVEDVERVGGTITFQSNSRFPRSSLVQIDHPLAPDLALVTSMSFYHDERGTVISKYEAKVLAGSAGLFAPEPTS